MSVARDVTTTPTPDATTVRAAHRALTDQLLQAVPPALRAVMVRLRAVMVAALALLVVMAQLRPVEMVVTRSEMARRVEMAQLRPAVTVVTRSVTVPLVEMTGVPVDGAFRNAPVPDVSALTARATIARVTMIL